MATATCSEKEDVLATCSICFEKYRIERPPKLLPCFHTFCLPCLDELIGRMLGADVKQACGDSDHHDHKSRHETVHNLTFLCPTCRTAICIPPGGAKQFQTNFYITDDASDAKQLQELPCEACNTGRNANYSCSDCCKKFCSQCLHFHGMFTSNHHVQDLKSDSGLKPVQDDIDADIKDKVMKQVIMLEAALAAIGQEHQQIDVQRQKLEDDLDTCHQTLVILVEQVWEQRKKDLQAVTQAEQDKLQVETKRIRQMLLRLWNILDCGGTRSESAAVVTDVHATLLKEEDLDWCQRHSLGKHSLCFACQSNAGVDIVQCVQAYFGTITVLSTEENANQDSNAEAGGEMHDKGDEPTLPSAVGFQDILTHVLKLSSECKDMYTALKKECIELQSRNEERYIGLKKECTEQQAISDERYSEVMCKVTESQAENKKQFSSIEDSCIKMKEQISSLKDGVFHNGVSVKDNIIKLQSDLTSLKESGENFKTTVAFHAKCCKDTFEGDLSILVFDRVILNIGNAYNPRTGVFIAPASGLYFFHAAFVISRPKQKVCMLLLQNWISLDAWIFEEHRSNTGKKISGKVQAIVTLKTGDGVFLNLSGCMHTVTDMISFSGILLHPEV